MPQNAKTGALANEFGHQTARKIAVKIGAVPVSETSSEFALNGRLVTIRCAHKQTIDVGITYNMLDRVDVIIAAFENESGAYELHQMTPALYRVYLRDSKNEGKVGLVRRATFHEIGEHLESIRIT